jgi:thioredoxin 1
MMSTEYTADEPSRSEVDAMMGLLVLEFGTNWCGYCRAAQSVITSAFATRENVTHLKVEDGPGRPLGRSFRVKLWPTLIFLRDGKEVARVVRPTDASAITEALDMLASD